MPIDEIVFRLVIYMMGHFPRISSIATINKVVSKVLPTMLISNINQSKNEKASKIKNTTQYINTLKKTYLTNAPHSIVLCEGSKLSLLSLGENTFNKSGLISPNKHSAPAAMPGVLVKISTHKPKTKPNNT